jgi:hypothetical protein
MNNPDKAGVCGPGAKIMDCFAQPGAMPLSLRRSPCGHITISRTSSMVTAKILEEKHAYEMLFFHQEKSFQDHGVSWVLRFHVSVLRNHEHL